eukprot:m.105558 g.105558  ORF g.105558 m.105558 type:complete len:303 (-) comp8921_c0_seq1:552-1460(-)
MGLGYSELHAAGPGGRGVSDVHNVVVAQTQFSKRLLQVWCCGGPDRSRVLHIQHPIGAADRRRHARRAQPELRVVDQALAQLLQRGGAAHSHPHGNLAAPEAVLLGISTNTHGTTRGRIHSRWTRESERTIERSSDAVHIARGRSHADARTTDLFTAHLALAGECQPVDALAVAEHQVVVQGGAATRCQLEGLVCTRGRDDGIRRGHGGDDVLDDALRQTVRNTVDGILCGPFRRAIEDPLDVLGVVTIDRHIGTKLRPEHDLDVFDAVLRQARRVGNRAERICDLRGVHVHGALDACRLAG